MRLKQQPMPLAPARRGSQPDLLRNKTKRPPKPAITTITMAPTGNQRGKRMWPSLPTANQIADVANWFFISSLVVGVVSTILIVWMAGVEESYWEKDRTESTERVALLTVQGDQLRKDTAEANARALEAQVALAKFKAP